MKLLFELSGEHPTLPVAELECVGRVLQARPQVAVADCPDPEEVRRLALTHVVLEYIGESRSDLPCLSVLLQELSLAPAGSFAVRVKKVHGAAMPGSPASLERFIGNRISGRVSLTHPDIVYHAVFSGDTCYLGRVLVRIDRGSYACRNPMRRPFFHPGVIMPRTARAIVNLSLIRRSERLYDPFCGTGGLLLEGGILGAEVLGSDADPRMAAGCRANLGGDAVLLADAARMPLCNAVMDAVVTDFPYGQSSWIRARTLENLYAETLTEIKRVLRPKRRAVVVSHRDIRAIARERFAILQYHEQRVHKSLTRRILVLQR